MLLRVADGKLRLRDLQSQTLTPGDSAARGEHELGVRCAVVLAQRGDEAGEVLFIVRGMDGIKRVLVALPPDEAGDLIALALVAGINLVETGERGLRVGHVIVVLLAGIPLDGFAGFLVEPRWWLGGGASALLSRPRVRLVLVTGEDLLELRAAALGDFGFIALAAGRQKIPAEAAIADAGL